LEAPTTSILSHSVPKNKLAGKLPHNFEVPAVEAKEATVRRH
jgi:hypothetical protein